MAKKKVQIEAEVEVSCCPCCGREAPLIVREVRLMDVNGVATPEEYVVVAREWPPGWPSYRLPGEREPVLVCPDCAPLAEHRVRAALRLTTPLVDGLLREGS